MYRRPAFTSVIRIVAMSTWTFVYSGYCCLIASAIKPPPLFDWIACSRASAVRTTERRGELNLVRPMRASSLFCSLQLDRVDDHAGLFVARGVAVCQIGQGLGLGDVEGADDDADRPVLSP